MKTKKYLILCLLLACNSVFAQEKVFPGADEKTPSRSQYFSWINNTNEGATEQQTMANLSFFEWLHNEYGMVLDIYAFDAGLIDGKNFYGSVHSDRFKKQFPTGLDNVYRKAKGIGTRLGVWGGPDGFGNTPEEAEQRKVQMEDLCKKYEWALFKFDAVCGELRPEKEDDFIDMMKRCRTYSPDLILLNHRLGLKKAEPYATTFLWGGQETYIDVHNGNYMTAPHNRAGAMDRGLVPELKRLTEDHGVCLSSCLNYWEDELILQAFNRSLILAPEIYGNPWLLADRDFPKLARIYNLHRLYGNILVDGITLPESYGPYAVSRGDRSTRLLTLRNLTWMPVEHQIKLDEEIGLKKGAKVYVRQYHPSEKIIGEYRYGETITVQVDPFRSLLIKASTKAKDPEPYVKGTDFEIIQNIPDKPVKIELLGMPGTTAEVTLPRSIKASKVFINGKEEPQMLKGKPVTVTYEGKALSKGHHYKVMDLQPSDNKDNADALYEATVFAADNNALEVRSLYRSGETQYKAVKDARDAFLNQRQFVHRGLWDKYLFDGDMSTGFWPSKRFGDQRIKRGCFRLDLGRQMKVDSIVLKLNSNFELEPYFAEEGRFAYISSDLKDWEEIVFMTGLQMSIPVGKEMRYLKLPSQPSCIREIEAYRDGRKIDPSAFRASNLFANVMDCQKMWTGSFTLDEAADNAYLSVALNGKHGVEGAYAALMVDGQMVGAPSRAISYPCNPWEYPSGNNDAFYTYYFPIQPSMVGKKIEVYVMGYNKDALDFQPEVWMSAYPAPFKRVEMLIER